MKARKLLSLALSITMIMSIFLSSTQAFAEGGEADNNDKTTVADQSVELEKDVQAAEQRQPESLIAEAQGDDTPTCTCTTNCSQDSINEECSLCSADYSKCAFVQSQCICGSLCTVEKINPDCPVCSILGAELNQCLGKSDDNTEAETPQEKSCALLPDCVDGMHGEGCPLFVQDGKKPCALTENCILEDGHQGECMTALTMSGTDGGEQATEYEAEYETKPGVWESGSLIQAVENVYSGGKIKLLMDVSVEGRGDFALRIEGKALSILGEGHKICLKNGSISVGNGGALNLGEEGYGNGLTLYSEDDTRPILYLQGNGQLNMYGGVTLGPSRAGGQAAGVYVTGDAVFNMHGGLITDCVNWASISGGVSITGCASFNMSGGRIENCSGYEGGAVGINPNGPIGSDPSGEASFVMTGGEIVNCTDNDYGGGAFFVNTSKAVNVDIRGGTISGCSAQGNSEKNGGAIALRLSNSNSRVNISGVHIDGCSASRGGGLFIDSSATVNIGPNTVISNNTASADGGGVYINKGKAVFGEGVQISGNTASSGNGGGICKAVSTESSFGKINVTNNSAGAQGGGIYFYGGPNMLEDTIIYNNSAGQAGDDVALVYNKNSFVWLSQPNTGLTLSKCGHEIDGWYADGDGSRWKGCGSGELNIKPQDVYGPIMATRNSGVFLKAAHGEVKAEPIVLRPMDMTIYMGGEAGNQLAISASGELVKTDSLPVPGFTVELPDYLKDTPIENLRLKYQKDENTLLMWRFVDYGPGEHGVYRISTSQGTETSNLRMKFTDANGNVVTDDSLDTSLSINQTLKMEVYDEDVPADKVQVEYKNPNDPGDTRNGDSYQLKVAEAKVFVRGVTPQADYGKLAEGVQGNSPGLAAGPGIIYYVNDTQVQADSTAGIALLFDDIIEVNNTGKTNTQLLTERSSLELENSGLGGSSGEIQYEFKYINLVDMNNGNAWISTNAPVTVYWPLPEGTTRDTEFELLHFKGLHRDMGVDQVGDNIMSEEQTVDNLTGSIIDVTDSHLVFTAGLDGFSPFALAWPASATGSLSVSKTVSGSAGETDREFKFTVTLSDDSIDGSYGDMSFTKGAATFSLKHGQSKTASGLPEGITYEVTEAEANKDGYVTSSTGASGTVVSGQTAAAAFTNTKNGGMPPSSTGSISVSKVVSGNGGNTDKYFSFTVVLGDKTINGWYDQMNFTDGVATFSLKHGESRTAGSLPAGTAYQVYEAEANKDNYRTTSKNAAGTIQADTTVQVSFTNYRAYAFGGFVPHTGDESNLGLWMALGGISLLAIAGGCVCLWVRSRKKRGR